MSLPRFSFTDYNNKIRTLISTGFPSLNNVLFQPYEDGGIYVPNDVRLPGFLMSYESPDMLESLPMRDIDIADSETTEGGALSAKTGYYLNIRVNVTGKLLLQKHTLQSVARSQPTTYNWYILTFQAACNIAALIHARAGKGEGWNCGPAEIKNIQYEEDDTYNIGIIDWCHEAFIGTEAGDSDDLLKVYADYFVCPEEDDDELTVEITDENINWQRSTE